MIKRFLISLTLFFAAVTALAQVDSLALEKVNGMLDEYLEAINMESPEAKCTEVDYLIETCTDSALRRAVAERLYDHFLTSQVMRDEEVAIHIYDKWYKTHEIEMGWDGALLNAAYFAEYNRQSLVGNKAPELVLYDRYNTPVLFPDLQGDARAVLFFYDVDCYKCRIEMGKLLEYLPTVEIPLDFYAVYTGFKGDMWDYFLDNEWNIESSYVRVHHLWDPSFESDMQQAYGITETPRMFLLGKDGAILGRRLNTDTLHEMLDFTSLQESLYSKNPVGSKLPKMKLPGTMIKGSKETEGVFRLCKPDYVMFYSPSCAHCREEIEGARQTRGKTLLVDVDKLAVADKDLFFSVLDAFDLSVLPHIVHLKNGKVLDKYITFIK